MELFHGEEFVFLTVDGMLIPKGIIWNFKTGGGRLSPQAQRDNSPNIIVLMKLEFHLEIIAQLCQGLIGFFFFNSKGHAKVFLNFYKTVFFKLYSLKQYCPTNY